MKFFVVCAVLLLSLLVKAEEETFVPIRYKSCKSLFEIVSVEASKCPLDEENRCIFTHEDTPTIRIGFKPDRDVQNLKAQVNARFTDKHVSFDLDNDNACNNQNLTCPLKSGEIYYYSQKVTIAKEYPAIEVIVNWLLNDPAVLEAKKEPYFDEDGERVKSDLCVVFMAKVNEKQ